jgi:glycosyltransferase involved in cell wall biosynthesis
MTDKRRTRVLFVHPTMSPFIESDLNLLRKNFDVKVVDVGSAKKDLSSKVRVLWRLKMGALWCDISFAWFAERHAKWMVRFSRILGKPSLVVVGGYEVAKAPEIGHGSLLNPNKAKMVKYILEKASKVLPVDESLKEAAIKNLGVRGDNIQTVRTGHDSEKFKASGAKERMALTVGFVDKITIKRKGLDVFVKTADQLKDVKFVLVGSSTDGTLDELRSNAPPNVEFVGAVPHDQLVAYYQRAKVYCQLSLFEGLPNALCEAMLCECVPVGTKVSGIPTAIGDTGFYAPVGDPKGAADAIRQALGSDNGRAARARIISELSVERREEAIIEIVEKLLA